MIMLYSEPIEKGNIIYLNKKTYKLGSYSDS